MSCNDDSYARSHRGEGNIQTVEESARRCCLRMGDHLIGWPLKTSLDLRMIEEAIVFSTHDIGQSRLVQICHHGIIAILTIQSQDGLM